jgi:hypothetical protein
MNDFTQDRWKKAADKNAMALISMKNYELGIAFFILAGKINDAINIALNKLKDLNLAILIARLVEGYDSDTVKDLINKHLIEAGKDVEDPWLVSIGNWWKGDHFEAINVLSSMIGETKQKLAKSVFSKGNRFSLFRHLISPVVEVDPTISTQSVAHSSRNVAETKPDTSFMFMFDYPIISGRNAFVLDFANQLLDHHLIKRELQKAQYAQDDSSSEEEEGGSIFDDFFGGGPSKQDQNKKEKHVSKRIEIDKQMLLSVVSDYYTDKGFVLLGLI